jgi:hypothetical protein
MRRFHNAMPAMYDGPVRLPTTMQGLDTLLAEFAVFPDGRHVDAVCNVVAHRELVIRRACLFGERLWAYSANWRAACECGVPEPRRAAMALTAVLSDRPPAAVPQRDAFTGARTAIWKTLRLRLSPTESSGSIMKTMQCSKRCRYALPARLIVEF